MLTIKYCSKNQEECSIENDCQSCNYYYPFIDYFGNSWKECIWNFMFEFTKKEYLDIIERLKIGL